MSFLRYNPRLHQGVSGVLCEKNSVEIKEEFFLFSEDLDSKIPDYDYQYFCCGNTYRNCHIRIAQPGKFPAETNGGRKYSQFGGDDRK